MADERTRLNWVFDGSGDWATAYCGRIIIGRIVMVDPKYAPDRERWSYSVDSIDPGRRTKLRGRVARRDSAKRAVERIWRLWLVRTGLL